MGTGKDFALWNNALSVEERLDAVVSELTLEEKLHCLTTGIPDIDRLGIKASFVKRHMAFRRVMIRRLTQESRSRPHPLRSRSV